MATELIAKGGGWYYPVDGDPDADKFRMSKKELKASDYTVVEVSVADEASAPAPAPATPTPQNEPTPNDTSLTPELIAQSEQQTWGPYNDYQFVTTPYGEYGVPAGRVLVRFELAKTRSGDPYMKPIYEGKDKMRTPGEIRALREQKQQRDQLLS
jgi:hypothetical protein